MKKTTKGAIAAGAAALLLAGGAGTFAAWSASETVGSDAEITTGELTLTENGTGAWAWTTPDVTGAFDPAGDTIVPGDSVTYTSSFDLKVVGTNLKAEGDIVLATGQTVPAGITVSSNADPSSNIDLTNLSDGDSGTIDIITTIEFDEAATASMNESFSLNGAQIVIKQTAPAQA